MPYFYLVHTCAVNAILFVGFSQSIGVGVSSDKGSPGGALNKEGPHIPRNGTMPLVREGCQKKL